MPAIPREIQERRDFEDEALRLGAERLSLESKLRTNLERIITLLEYASDVGVSVERYAQMVGIRRQQLYRHRATLARLQEGHGDRRIVRGQTTAR